MTTTTTTDGMMAAAVPNETVERMYIKREKKTVPGALNALNGGKVLTYISPWKVLSTFSSVSTVQCKVA